MLDQKGRELALGDNGKLRVCAANISFPVRVLSRVRGCESAGGDVPSPQVHHQVSSATCIYHEIQEIRVRTFRSRSAVFLWTRSGLGTSVDGSERQTARDVGVHDGCIT